jgi:hypothetical protein
MTSQIHLVTEMTSQIPIIKVVRSVYYNPEVYLDSCKETGEEPTQDGFFEFIQDFIYDDFSLGNYIEDVEYVK